MRHSRVIGHNSSKRQSFLISKHIGMLTRLNQSSIIYSSLTTHNSDFTLISCFKITALISHSYTNVAHSNRLLFIVFTQLFLSSLLLSVIIKLFESYQESSQLIKSINLTQRLQLTLILSRLIP